MFQNHDSGTLCLVFHQEVYDSDTGETYSCLYHSLRFCWGYGSKIEILPGCSNS